MNDKGVCRTAPATPGLLGKGIIAWQFYAYALLPEVSSPCGSGLRPLTQTTHRQTNIATYIILNRPNSANQCIYPWGEKATS